MRLVRTQKVSLLNLGDGQLQFCRPVVELAPHAVEVHDPGVLPVLRQLVDLLQPLHLAVAEERISGDQKFRQRTWKRKREKNDESVTKTADCSKRGLEQKTDSGIDKKCRVIVVKIRPECAQSFS